MNEHPILFSGEMVQAILEGRKTQTRRVIRTVPNDFVPNPHNPYDDGVWHFDHPDIMNAEQDERVTIPIRCPYGVPGDLLWVREAWATPGNYDSIKPSELAASHFTRDQIVYRATEQYGDVYYRWRPSIFMPRWASRITLEVVSVRVERVQDISERDAYAEGIGLDPTLPHPLQWFKELWDSINAKRGYPWQSNPWVWVVEFRQT